ncbi:von willebrand factor A domain protein [Quillaja saponaria]|uniref:von willebrand factor A domain protein n=1 Tax=Quillaja saponaria TaxID=32244 RepID=A0AAD7PHR5_QUISA|nr:von willebrand factor A domain protein [Quillaja saponaria]
MMDGRGGCCIARYAGGTYGMSTVDRIMRQFRPIAPKPATGSTSSGKSSEKGLNKGCRAKRKYVKDNNNINKRCNRRRKASPEERDTMVTLPLLPETPDRKDFPFRDATVITKEVVKRSVKSPIWLNFENCSSDGNMDPSVYLYGGKKTEQTVVMPQPVRVEYSYVTVQCATEKWMDGGLLGSTDEERKVKLGKDTCPGFISDKYGRVTWTNTAYRKILCLKNDDEEVVMKVRLVIAEKVVVAVRELPPDTAFTCKVRVESTCGKERSSLTVPCDVWQMESGGFAWRLDVKAALSLSLGR